MAKNRPNIHITSPWSMRLSNAERYYNEWAKRFKCTRLEDYYEGFQWRHKGMGLLGLSPYVLNLVYATIKRKIGNIVYTSPEFSLTPRPGRMDWDQDFAVQSTNLKQDTLNTVIQNPNLNLTNNIRLSALDSFFRFGVLEVGYAADWRNPQQPKLEMKSWTEPNLSEDRDKVIKQAEVLENERVYVKWVSAKRFRVSASDDPHLRNCNWCGYYSFMSKDVLMNTKGIDFPAELRNRYYSIDYASAEHYFSESEEKMSKQTAEALSRGEIMKVWNIWDNVTSKRLLLLDGTYEELYAEPFERINLATYRFDLSLKGWYPIPPVWQWLSAQDEINESREQMRRYRRRFTRKFEVIKNAVDSDELEKLKDEEDGAVIEARKATPDGSTNIKPIPNPEIGVSITEGLVASKDDFNIVAANTVARGRGSDRQTATATREQAQDEDIAQSVEQIDFSTFICDAGREVLLQISENFEEGLWIKINQDPGDFNFGEYQQEQPIYKYVESQVLNDGYDFDIKLNVTNATPAQMQQEKQAMIEFLQIIYTYPGVAMSAPLIREVAYRVGYRNERVIKNFQQMAMIALMEKAAASQQGLMQQGLLSGPQNTAPAGNTPGAGAAGSPSAIAAQLQEQVKPVGQ